MADAEDLSGREFGFLKAVSRAPDKITPSGQKRRMWNCKCLLCGNKIIFSAQDLKRRTAKSCGCHEPKRQFFRNKKICVICKKDFESPPSAKTVTCSNKCRRIYASQRSKGHKLSEESRRKISMASAGRDMSNIHALAIAAAIKSPNSGRFETNVNAIDWHLISPEGKHFYFHSLSFWMRKNCKEFFGCDPDSREFNNAMSGLRGAKRGAMGKTKYCTYKGWRVIPTRDDKI